MVVSGVQGHELKVWFGWLPLLEPFHVFSGGRSEQKAISPGGRRGKLRPARTGDQLLGLSHSGSMQVPEALVLCVKGPQDCMVLLLLPQEGLCLIISGLWPQGRQQERRGWREGKGRPGESPVSFTYALDLGRGAAQLEDA